jgi:sugar phosphate isomerase/epimerase
MSLSRREFVVSVSVAALGTMISRPALSYPLGLEPGIQLWSVKDNLKADTARTLRELKRVGFRKLELYELPASPRDFRKLCDDLGLSIVSGHFYFQALADERTLETAHTLGLKYLIIVFPTLRSIRDKDISGMGVKELAPLYEKITLDDYRWNAEQFNKCGERVKRAGFELGYHNHAVDLKRLGGKVALDELIENTRPELVLFEMDCGHVIHAGADPIQYLERYPTRIQLLHLKDLKPGFGISSTIDTEDKDTNAELGAGVIDWRRFFAVAAHGNIEQWFIEHEGAMDDPPLSAVAHSLRYLQQF